MFIDGFSTLLVIWIIGNLDYYWIIGLLDYWYFGLFVCSIFPNFLISNF